MRARGYALVSEGLERAPATLPPYYQTVSVLHWRRDPKAAGRQQGLRDLAAIIGGVIAILAIAAFIIVVYTSQSQHANDSDWVGSGRVCDFDGKCTNEFKCRRRDGQVEIYLPTGSFGQGNEGWSWQEDVGGRC